MNHLKAEYRRSANLNIRFTPPEMRALRDAANAADFPPSSWARRVLLASLKSQAPSPPPNAATKPRR